MGYNRKKQAQLKYEHHDKMLEKQREGKGHDEEKDGPYDRILGETRKDEEKVSIHEKQLEKHHREASESPRITEKWFEDENKRDDSTWKTNTLPINELAEEAQRRRMEYRGDGDGFVKDHFQDYKKKSVNLSDENYAKLSGVMDKMDKLWMASAWGRMTTAEKKTITALKKERNKIIKAAIDQIHHERGSSLDQVKMALELGNLLLSGGYSESTYDDFQSYLNTALFQNNIKKVEHFVSMGDEELKSLVENPYNISNTKFEDLIKLRKIVEMVDSSIHQQ